MIVRPYFANIGKRLVKAPKVYFTDLGDRCGAGFLVHAGQGRLPKGHGVTAAGFSEL